MLHSAYSTLHNDQRDFKIINSLKDKLLPKTKVFFVLYKNSTLQIIIIYVSNKEWQCF